MEQFLHFENDKPVVLWNSMYWQIRPGKWIKKQIVSILASWCLLWNSNLTLSSLKHLDAIKEEPLTLLQINDG